MPSHYLNQCWNIVDWNFRDKLQWNLKQNSYIFIQENAFENVVSSMVAILTRPQCVKEVMYQMLSHKVSMGVSKLSNTLLGKESVRIVTLLGKESIRSGSSRSMFHVGFCRCSLMGFDLNRHWQEPSPWAHPTLYATKNLLMEIDNNGVSCQWSQKYWRVISSLNLTGVSQLSKIWNQFKFQIYYCFVWLIWNRSKF